MFCRRHFSIKRSQFINLSISILSTSTLLSLLGCLPAPSVGGGDYVAFSVPVKEQTFGFDLIYSAPLDVALTARAESVAAICYSLDGSNPQPEASGVCQYEYDESQPITLTSTLPIKAIIRYEDGTYSRVFDRHYNVVDLYSAGDGVTLEASAVYAGDDHSCVLNSNDSDRLYCWGDNRAGELGDGTVQLRATPTLSASPEAATSVVMGVDHGCAVYSGMVKCWGDNSFGQLGSEVTSRTLAPLLVDSLTNVTALTAGWNHTCALKTDDTVVCWGAGAGGQLGNNERAKRRLPSPVLDGSGILTGVAAIAAGGNNTCALMLDRTVSCWGDNASNQLGPYSGSRSLMAVPVNNIVNALDVTVGNAFVCTVVETAATTGTGGVKCWGIGVNGQLGTGASAPPISSDWPRVVVYEGSLLNVDSVVSVKAGARHACALRQDGRVICWGANHWSQLGVGDEVNRNSAVIVQDESDNSLSSVVSISTGGRHVLALLSSGEVYSWGDNNYGQVGNGSIDVGAPPPHTTRQVAGPVLLVAQ